MDMGFPSPHPPVAVAAHSEQVNPRFAPAGGEEKSRRLLVARTKLTFNTCLTRKIVRALQQKKKISLTHPLKEHKVQGARRTHQATQK